MMDFLLQRGDPWMTSDANLIRPPKSTDRWSIGIYAGRSPFDLNPAPAVVNPVLNAGDVTDVDAAFVADPFMIREDGYWHMFFEVLNREHQRGEIGWATSPDGISWSYQRIVLREPYHLSYPHVFRWQGAWFMIPETLGANGIQLYQATRFPTEWRSVAVLLSGQFADPTIFRYRGRWWLFACHFFTFPGYRSATGFRRLRGSRRKSRSRSACCWWRSVKRVPALAG